MQSADRFLKNVTITCVGKDAEQLHICHIICGVVIGINALGNCVIVFSRLNIQIVVLFLGRAVMSDDLLDIDQKNQSEYMVDRRVLMFSLALTHDQVMESSQIPISGIYVHGGASSYIVKNHVLFTGNWVESEIKSDDTRLREMPCFLLHVESRFYKRI